MDITSFIEVSFCRWNRGSSTWTPRTVSAWWATSRSSLTTPLLSTGTPWSPPLKLILPFNVFPLISGDTSLKPLSVDLNCLFQYTKRSKRSSTSHTNRHVWRSSVWCWPAALSPGLLSSQNILRQRSWEEAERRREKGSETSYDAQWEAKTGRDVPWILWKVSFILLARAGVLDDREKW